MNRPVRLARTAPLPLVLRRVVLPAGVALAVAASPALARPAAQQGPPSPALRAAVQAPDQARPAPPPAGPVRPQPGLPVPGAPPGRPAPQAGHAPKPQTCTPVGALPPGEPVPAEKILKDLHEGKNVELRSVLIEGNLDADLEWPVPPDDRRTSMRVVAGHLRLEGCRVAGRVAFRRAVFLQGMELPCSEIRGDLDLAEADVPSLVAPRLHVVGPVRLGGIATGEDVDLTGAVLDDRLEAGGRIRGDLRLTGAELRGGGELARLVAGGLDVSFTHVAGPLRVTDTLLLSDLTAASGTFARGIALDGARVEGDADFDDARSPTGIALAGLAVSGDLGIALEEDSPLSLTDVTVGGDLSLFDGRVRNLLMERVTVRGDTEFESCRLAGKVTLHDSDFGRSFTADDASFLGDCEFRRVRFPGTDPLEGARFARAPALIDTPLPVPPTVEGDSDGTDDEGEDLDFQDVDAPQKK